MAKRAFIIAIEEYAQIQEGLSKQLTGTHAQALAFRDCLIQTLGVDAKNICFCTEDPALPGRTSDATRAAIKAEIRRFQTIAKDQTDDFFFYFSGHGFCYTDVDGVPAADVLVASDYVRPQDSGDACLKLDEIQKWLKLCIGVVPPDGAAAGTPANGAHFYFIDACRNLVSEKAIKVIELGLTYDLSAKRRPPVHTVYSATTGALAKVGSDFPAALIDGLQGKGRAKAWYQGELAVLVDRLREYIEARLKTTVDANNDGGSGLVRRIDPVPEFTCTIAVKNADAADVFTVDVKNEKNQHVDGFDFTGPAHTFTKVPDDYFVQLSLKTAGDHVVTPDAPVRADLYDDCPLEFAKGPRPARSPFESARPGGGPGGAPRPAATTRLTVIPPAFGEVTLLGGKDPLAVVRGASLDVAPGRYTLETRDPRGQVIDRRDVMLGAGDQVIDLTVFLSSPLRDAVLANFKAANALDHGAIGFSETLGFSPDQGLDLWLAIMGASRIVGAPGEFSKLSPLPLERFDLLAPGLASVYVLAGFDNAATVLRVALSRDWHTAPVEARRNPGLPGLFEVVQPAESPSQLYLTVQLDTAAPLTFGVFTLPSRVSLVTLTQDARGGLVCQQFILPPKHLMDALPQRGGMTLLGFGGELAELSMPLRVVRRCVDVQRTFAGGRELALALSATELEWLLYFKWFEPIVALMASYELVRRGRIDQLPKVVGNLRNSFAGLPDTEALARMAGLPFTPPIAPPLILEGFQALDFMPGKTDLPPQGALMFRSHWTTWRGLQP